MRTFVVVLALAACSQPQPQAPAAPTPAPVTQITLGAVPESVFEGGAACWARDASGAAVFLANGGTGYVNVDGAVTRLDLIGDGGASADGGVRTVMTTTADQRELEPDVVGGPARFRVTAGAGGAELDVTYACLAGY